MLRRAPCTSSTHASPSVALRTSTSIPRALHSPILAPSKPADVKTFSIFACLSVRMNAGFSFSLPSLTSASHTAPARAEKSQVVSKVAMVERCEGDEEDEHAF